MAGLRILKLLPGIGHATAAKVLDAVEVASDPIKALTEFVPPKPATDAWPAFIKLIRRLHRDKVGWPAEVDAVLAWYRPIMQEHLDDHRDRLADLDQLQSMAGTFKSRRKFLTDLSLDPPSKRQKPGSAPQDEDDDCLTLSTIHSCKGREWRTVFVLSVIEGCLPSSKAKTDAEIEEERRLLYVAMTRAKTDLTLMTPWRVRVPGQSDHGFGGDGTVARSSFIPDNILDCFERIAWRAGGDEPTDDPVAGGSQFDLPGRIRNQWRF